MRHTQVVWGALGRAGSAQEEVHMGKHVAAVDWQVCVPCSDVRLCSESDVGPCGLSIYQGKYLV